eukprot:jgi/Mesvir1/1754/Mv11891-RA.1
MASKPARNGIFPFVFPNHHEKQHPVVTLREKSAANSGFNLANFLGGRVAKGDAGNPDFASLGMASAKSEEVAFPLTLRRLLDDTTTILADAMQQFETQLEALPFIPARQPFEPLVLLSSRQALQGDTLAVLISQRPARDPLDRAHMAIRDALGLTHVRVTCDDKPVPVHTANVVVKRLHPRAFGTSGETSGREVDHLSLLGGGTLGGGGANSGGSKAKRGGASRKQRGGRQVEEGATPTPERRSGAEEGGVDHARRGGWEGSEGRGGGAGEGGASGGGAQQWDWRWRALVPTTPLDEPRVVKVTVEVRDGRHNRRHVTFVAVKKKDFPVQHIWLGPSKAPLIGTRTESGRISSVVATRSSEQLWRGPFVVPSDGVVTTEYGLQRTYNGEYARGYYHRGVDYGADKGKPVVAPSGGRVILRGLEKEGFPLTGNVVGIDHGHGVVSILMHLDSIATTEGKMVQAGELIGTVGDTGIATGPHLHWGLFVGGECVDPKQWMEPQAWS